MLLYEVHDGAELSAVIKSGAKGPMRICEISPFRTMFQYLTECGMSVFHDTDSHLYYKKQTMDFAKQSTLQGLLDMCIARLQEKRYSARTTFQQECLEEDYQEFQMIREETQRREAQAREQKRQAAYQNVTAANTTDSENEAARAAIMNAYNARIIAHRGTRPSRREPDLPPHMMI